MNEDDLFLARQLPTVRTNFTSEGMMKLPTLREEETTMEELELLGAQIEAKMNPRPRNFHSRLT